MSIENPTAPYDSSEWFHHSSCEVPADCSTAELIENTMRTLRGGGQGTFEAIGIDEQRRAGAHIIDFYVRGVQPIIPVRLLANVPDDISTINSPESLL